jgi:hypothetical protein
VTDSHHNGDVNVDVDKDIDVNIDFNLDSDVDINLDKEVNVDVDVYSDVHVDGNFASATFSAEAFGHDTLAEADVHVMAVEDQLSTVDGTLIAAAS